MGVLILVRLFRETIKQLLANQYLALALPKLWWKSMGITVEGLGTSKLFEREAFVSCTYQWYQPAACYGRPGPIVPSQFSIETSY
jgi:hypothetical protein